DAEPGEDARAAVKADHARAEKQARRRAAPDRRRVLTVVSAAILILGSLYLHFSPTVRAQLNDLAEPDQLLDLPRAMSLILCVLLGISVLRMILSARRARRQTQQIARVSTQLLRGEREAAARDLDVLARSPLVTIAAHAELLRATMAERSGDFAEV